MITIQEAVISLRPNVEWSMNGDDVEGIIWHTEGAEPLTMAEVQAERERLEASEIVKEAEARQARLDAIQHAKSLGFTDAMIAVMYPNLGAN
jgi:hypothetical protein